MTVQFTIRKLGVNRIDKDLPSVNDGNSRLDFRVYILCILEVLKNKQKKASQSGGAGAAH